MHSSDHHQITEEEEHHQREEREVEAVVQLEEMMQLSEQEGEDEISDMKIWEDRRCASLFGRCVQG